VGEQELPPAVSVQVTPLLEESFCTVALSVTADDPAVMVEIGFVMLTEIAGAGVTVIFSVAEAEVSATEVAVTVTSVLDETEAGAL
jgi:hypothetical protein